MRRLRHYLRLLAAGVVAAFAGECMTAEPGPAVSYNRDVRPILSDRCFACHGPDEHQRKAKLRLDTREGIFRTRRDVTVVAPKRPEDSELFRRISTDDPSECMPPTEFGKSLSPREIELIRRWIESGAAYEEHWSYARPRRPPLPAIREPAWARNPIDRFIGRRLDEHGLQPSAPADRRTLIRRLSFDLVGSPPTFDEVEAFVQDDRPDFLERTVDRLLGSPHYGERMAVYWLDLVRYADTVGYHGDQEHHISLYRDWVIDSLNANVPFDQFTSEQLAGDLMANATIDQRVASGYNRLLQTTHEGGAQDKEYRAIYAADRVRNVGLVWLGATLGCAQCHDHKFDPYTLKDFYSMAAFFADLDERGAYAGPDVTPTKRPPEIAALSRRERTVLEQLKNELATLDESNTPDDRTARTGTKVDRRDVLLGEIKRIEEGARQTMVSSTVTPRLIRVLPRGNWLDETGPVVEPGIPAFLGRPYAGDRRLTRLDLARWLVSAENPLTARTFVNRLWSLFVGTGLVKTLDDLGSQGDRPVHRELLDLLAVEFVESGWNIKHVIRLIVSSQTYRQSSHVTAPLLERDPENRLYARQSATRLPAEFIRDMALATSGLLVHELGGPSMRPYQPDGYYQHLNFPPREYKADADKRQWRRGVYMHWQRQFLHPMLLAFDAPQREECSAARPVSNTPRAALTLLNDPTFVEAARVLGVEAMRAGAPNDRIRVDSLFRRVLSRPAAEPEIDMLIRLLVAHRRAYQSDRAAAQKLTRVGLAPVPRDIDAAEHAAWTSVARVMLNLDEAITRE